MKTLFDPCPVGWRVPHSRPGNGNPWAAFTLDNSVWDASPGAGRRFSATVVFGGTAWFPAAGRRQVNTGNPDGWSTVCFVWTAGPNGLSCYSLYTHASLVRPYDTNGRAYSHSVRCIRE